MIPCHIVIPSTPHPSPSATGLTADVAKVQRQTMEDKLDAFNQKPNKWTGVPTTVAAKVTANASAAPEAKPSAEPPGK